MEELYQKGMELWETAEQLIKQHKIDSSEGRSETVSYQKQAVECWQTAAEQGDARAQHQLGYYYYNYRKNSNKNKRHLNGTARPLNRDMLRHNMNLVSYIPVDWVYR